MTTYQYTLGSAEYMVQLFPNPVFADKDLGFNTYADVIKHYTVNSLEADGIDFSEVDVHEQNGMYAIKIIGHASLETLKKFGKRHNELFSKDYAQKAIAGVSLLKELNVWNPMEGYWVNKNQGDGPCKWALFPPLGLNVIGQRGMTLMHYPPWAVLTAGTFDNAMTMQRWTRILEAAGINESDTNFYKTFIDVNPIAAPGSGQSEYPNDYFPIMMASGFFDGPKGSGRDYIRSMMEIYLSPPDHPEDAKYTLPLLICGSPLYDPQAPGWFRAAYTDILPQEDNIPQVNVLQTGKFKIYPDSEKETPYMICNHMIAAGVTGKCTNDPASIPDIRQYEAQDLVAATFLKLYHDNPSIDPADAKKQACQRWFGNDKGYVKPNPPDSKDKALICALAQVDLFFVPTPTPHPKYTMEEALKRCAGADPLDDPCACGIKPDGPKGDEIDCS
ncbi:MAG: hypothetical protein HKO89_02440 [Saprospiraceae bacterium]|nr:hypothetical protein [Saprospiraceae bacterium]